MTVSEAITKSGITPSASYTGIETTNDFVLAFQIESTQTKESQWIVCADHVKEHSGSLNATTEDSQYIRTGNVTDKTGTQRTLAVNGDRCVGDAFQDFVLSHKIVYGTGSDVIVPYIYFSLRTGKGEKGSAAIIVTSDVGGAAGSKATFACDVKAIGTPDEFDYNPATQSAEPAKAVKAVKLIFFQTQSPLRTGTGIFYAVNKAYSSGAEPGHGPRKEPEHGYLWTGI